MTPATLPQALSAACRQWPSHPALSLGKRTLTYGELDNAVRALARAYSDMRVTRGDRIVCAVSNRPEHIIAAFAAWSCGAVHVGADPNLPAAEILRLIDLTGARVLLFEPSVNPGSSGATLDLLRLRQADLRVLVVSDCHVPAGLLELEDVLLRAATHEVDRSTTPASYSEMDAAVIFMTSGTTGTPRAAVGTHGNLARRWEWIGEALEFKPRDIHLAQLPLAHGFGQMMAVAALFTGGHLVLLNKFSPGDAIRLIRERGITVLNGAPAHFKLILSTLRSTGGDVGTLRTGAGSAAPFTPALIRAIVDDLGMQFMLMYGASEGVGVVTTDRGDLLRGSVGRPAPGTVAILDEDERPMPMGQIGEIAFARKVFRVQYWGEASEAMGWHHSGDLGRLDEDGRLYVLGRLKHQINRGGIKIDPLEVETALLQYGGIADAAVIGLGNAVLGETVCACVVPAVQPPPALVDLRAALGGVLAEYKLPQELCVLDSIPRTPIGKVDLPRLRVLVGAQVGASTP